MKGLIESWWLFVLRGVAACLFGVLLLARPGPTLATLVLVYGAYALVEGGLTLYGGIVAGARQEHGGMLIFSGIVGILAGAVTLMWPGLTAIALFFIVATWAIVLGVLQMVNGLRLRNFIEHAWLLALAGAFFTVLGIVMLANPVIGVAFLVATTATFAFVIGGVEVLWGLRLHELAPPIRR